MQILPLKVYCFGLHSVEMPEMHVEMQRWHVWMTGRQFDLEICESLNMIILLS